MELFIIYRPSNLRFRHASLCVKWHLYLVLLTLRLSAVFFVLFYCSFNQAIPPVDSYRALLNQVRAFITMYHTLLHTSLEQEHFRI